MRNTRMHRRYPAAIRALTLTGLSLLFAAWASLGFAHSVTVWAEPAGDKVRVEAYYGDGSPVDQAYVAVLDTDGNVIMEIKTGDDGSVEFVRPTPAALTIRLDLGDGHDSTFELEPADS